MASRDNERTNTTNGCEPIDVATSVSICRAVGERLRQKFVPDRSGLPPHLQHLLDQLRLHDSHPPQDLQ
jgi:hypothetical protein